MVPTCPPPTADPAIVRGRLQTGGRRAVFRRTLRWLAGPGALAGLACLGLLALTACGSEPSGTDQRGSDQRGTDQRGADRQSLPETPSNNSFTRGVNTMTGSIPRSRDAAADAQQRSNQAAAAANAID